MIGPFEIRHCMLRCDASGSSAHASWCLCGQMRVCSASFFVRAARPIMAWSSCWLWQCLGDRLASYSWASKHAAGWSRDELAFCEPM